MAGSVSRPDLAGIRAAPRIVVGNSPNGDVASEVDYLDTGNGAQLAAAISAAGPGSDIWVRPGDYDLSLPGAPAILPNPANGTKIRGADREGTRILSQTTGNQRIWAIGASRVELSDLQFFLQGGDGAGVLDSMIRVTGQQCVFSRVDLRVDGAIDPNNTAIRRLVACTSAFNVLFQCRAGIDAATLPGFDAVIGSSLIGFFCDEVTDFLQCECWGADVGFSGQGIRALMCLVFAPALKGFEITGGSNSELVQCKVVATGIGVDVLSNATRIKMSALRLLLNVGVGAIGVQMQADRCNLSDSIIDQVDIGVAMNTASKNNVIIGNDIDAGTTGILLVAGSDDNIVSNNQVTAGVTRISNSGTGNEIVHNK